MNNQNDKQQTPKNPVPRPYPYYAHPPEDEMNLFDLWKILTEQKKIIGIVTTIFTLVAIGYVLLATPIYRAEALLAPVEKGKGSQFGSLAAQFGGLASLAGIDVSSGEDSVAISIATLKSREFTNNFIQDENLIHVLFEGNWDSKNKVWINTEKKPSMWEAYKLFNSIREVSQDKRTGLVKITIDWKDPVLAAEWVNKLVARVNHKLRQEAISNAERSLKYLESELQKTSIIEIKESIYSLIEAQTKTKMLANTRDEYAFRLLDTAVIPEEKIKPKSVLIVVLAFILSTIIGIFLVLIKQVNWQ